MQNENLGMIFWLLQVNEHSWSNATFYQAQAGIKQHCHVKCLLSMHLTLFYLYKVLFFKSNRENVKRLFERKIQE